SLSPSGTINVVYGSTINPVELSSSSYDGAIGFTIVGKDNSNLNYVAGNGDLNGDNTNDILLLAPSLSEAYMLFGTSSFPASVSITDYVFDGTNGFRITGVDDSIIPTYTNYYNAYPTMAQIIGDINGDNRDDMVFAFREERKAIVVYGRDSYPGTIDITSLTADEGFTINGSSSGNFGVPGRIGDVNGDNIEDILLTTDIGQAYVVFCKSENFAGDIDVDDFDRSDGYVIGGLNGLVSTSKVSGDIDNDGIKDVLLGFYELDSETGGVYVN
ncbi:MAG: hypothetical protein AAF153_03110, partial [Pseudomonadota bacterium]